MGLFALNMGRHQVALCVTLALFLQILELQAKECNKRTTFIQIRIPQKTNLAVKYPKEIDPVQFVPFPYNPAGSGCMKCQGTTCTKCVYTKTSQTSSNVHTRKTNIIIDIKGTKQFNESIADANISYNDSSAKVDGTIVGIYDKTSAASVSGASAQSDDNGNSSAVVASGTALSQSDILAAIDEEEVNKIDGSKSHVEDVYVLSEDISTANANSTSASEGDDKSENSTSSDTLTKTDETQSSTTIVEKDSSSTIALPPTESASGVTTNDSSQQASSGNDSAALKPDASAIPGSDASAVDKKPDSTSA